MNKIQTKLKLDSKYKGASAMLVTVSMSLLFIALVVSLSFLSLREQRMSSDTEMASQAMAEAELWLRDGMSLDSTIRENNCRDFEGRSGGRDMSKLQCRTITDKPGPLIFLAQKDQTKKAEVYLANYNPNENDEDDASDDGYPEYSKTGVRYATEFQVYWCKLPSSTDCMTTTQPFTYQKEKPVPALELGFSYWEVDSTAQVGPDISTGVGNVNKPIFNSGNLYRTYQTPRCSGGGCALDSSTYQFKTILLHPALSGRDASLQPGHNIENVKVKCSQDVLIRSDGYGCMTERVSLAKAIYSKPGAPLITDADAYKYRLVFSVTPRFANSMIKVVFYNKYIKPNEFPGVKTMGDVVPVPASVVTIDVTTKIGNIYKRIKGYRQKQTEAMPNTLPSVYSGADICKTMTTQLSTDDVQVGNGDESKCIRSDY